MSKNNYSLNAKRYTLTIGWLYPELMSTYGDRGNIIVLQKRCEWRGIEVNIERISLETNNSSLTNCDLLFMGGAQDTQQEIVNNDLLDQKGDALKEIIEKGIPGLFICGAYQFLGKYYKTSDGTELKGLSIFPCHTENPGGDVNRLIGNVIAKPINYSLVTSHYLVGFENHGGRTYLEDKSQAFATIEKGFGNNGEDKTEGVMYKNAIGTYLHGPILPKNPELADWLIEKALEVKYGKKIELKPLDDSLEQKAKEVVVKRIIT